MRSPSWVTLAALCLVAMTLQPGMSYANLVGNANVTQITEPLAFGPGGGSGTYLPSDTITFRALYYDSNDACNNIATLGRSLVVLTLEGVILQVIDAQDIPGQTVFGPAFSKYRRLTIDVSAASLGPGDFRFSFLVRDRANTKTVIYPVGISFRVISP